MATVIPRGDPADGQHQVGRRDAGDVEAQIDALQTEHRPDHQAGAGEKRDSQHDLENHQRAPSRVARLARPLLRTADASMREDFTTGSAPVATTRRQAGNHV